MRRLAVVVAALLVSAGPAPTAFAQDDSGDASLGEARATAPKRTASYRASVEDAIVDIQSFWSDEFPSLYGGEYDAIPRKRIIAGRPGVKLPKCQGTTITYEEGVLNNAFYCYVSNFIAYDDADLLPRLHRDFGALAVPLVFAHEFGHAIQDRADNVDQPTILKELQADCFAGAWLDRVATGESDRIELESGNLDSALAALLTVRDPVGTTPDSPDAHGSGFDRAAAFQEGFEGSGEACVDYFENQPLIVEIPFGDSQDAATGGNLPAEEVIPATVDLLNDYYTQVEAAYVPRSTDDVFAFDSTTGKKRDLPVCGGVRQEHDLVENRVFYCPTDASFAFDEPYLQRIYQNIGDFGVTTLVANPFASYVQTIQGFPGVETNATNAVLGADCYTGGFAAAMFNGALLVDPSTGEPAYALSPGDLDETIQAFIDYAPARDVASDVDITFVRLEAFRDGFFNGYDTCAAYQQAPAGDA